MRPISQASPIAFAESATTITTTVYEIITWRKRAFIVSGRKALSLYVDDYGVSNDKFCPPRLGHDRAHSHSSLAITLSTNCYNFFPFSFQCFRFGNRNQQHTRTLGTSAVLHRKYFICNLSNQRKESDISVKKLDFVLFSK